MIAPITSELCSFWLKKNTFDMTLKLAKAFPSRKFVSPKWENSENKINYFQIESTPVSFTVGVKLLPPVVWPVQESSLKTCNLTPTVKYFRYCWNLKCSGFFVTSRRGAKNSEYFEFDHYRKYTIVETLKNIVSI